MKKLIGISFLLLSFAGISQNNVIKLGISGVNYGDFFLSYERVVTPQSTVNVTMGYWNLNASLINFAGIFSSSDGIRLKQFNSGIHGSVDYRFYVGRKIAPRGIYIGPYLRYWDHSLIAIDDIEQETFDVDTRIWSISLGFQMGYHWVINDYISIDWYFIGLGIESISSSFVYTTTTTGFDYSTIVDDFLNVFDDFDYLYQRINTTHSSENMTARLPFIAPGIRTGLTIGIAF